MEWWLEQNNLLPDKQYGFGRVKGTIDCAAKLVADIQLTLLNGQYLGALYPVISIAYDIIILDLLLNKLLGIKLSTNFA